MTEMTWELTSGASGSTSANNGCYPPSRSICASTRDVSLCRQPLLFESLEQSPPQWYRPPIPASMARKLPWVEDTSSLTLQRARNEPSPRKRTRTERSGPDTADGPPIARVGHDHDPSLCTGPRLPQPTRRPNSHSSARSRSRSPGTTIPQVVYMNSGLERDDGWRMVEDEFLETAQSFTRHLHHAEYKRVVKEAHERRRNRHLKGDNHRYTASEILTVSGKAALRQKQDHELQGSPSSIESEGNEGMISPDAKAETADLFAEPTLSGLMTYDVRSKRILKGLDKIASDSRASRGLRPNITTSTHAAQTDRFPSIARDVDPTLPDCSQDLVKRKVDAWSSPQHKHLNNVSELDKPVRSNRRVFQRYLDDLDDFEDQAFPTASPDTRVARTDTSFHARTRSLKTDQKKKVSMDEVPVFLV